MKSVGPDFEGKTSGRLSRVGYFDNCDSDGQVGPPPEEGEKLSVRPYELSSISLIFPTSVSGENGF